VQKLQSVRKPHNAFLGRMGVQRYVGKSNPGRRMHAVIVSPWAACAKPCRAVVTKADDLC
jgi:hypothetical protein